MTSLTKAELRQALTRHGVTVLPPTSAKKDELVSLYEQHIIKPLHQAKAGDSSIVNIDALNDDELMMKLKENGIALGPIVAATRGFYKKKLASVLRGESMNGSNGNWVNDTKEKDMETEPVIEERDVETVPKVEGKEVETISGSKFPVEKLPPSDDYNCGKEMNDHIGKLFGEKKFSDVKITCGEEVFFCHRNILSVRSPVFKAMFHSDMIENHSQNVVIKDVKPEVVKEMLHFIYNGATSTEKVMDEIAKDLLGAADQYHLELLKNKCEDKLCSSLEVSNSVELLGLADLHRAAKLRRMALKLVNSNLDSIVNTNVYKDFVVQHPVLALQITQALVQKVGMKRKRENNND